MCIYLHVHMYVYMTTSYRLRSAVDLYCCSCLYVKCGRCAEIVGAIVLQVQFGGRMHVSIVELLDFDSRTFREILLMISN